MKRKSSLLLAAALILAFWQPTNAQQSTRLQLSTSTSTPSASAASPTATMSVLSGSAPYVSLGCFGDAVAMRALRSNEGKGISDLDGLPLNRTDAIEKCYRVASQFGHNVFALQNGECYSMTDVIPNGDYARYGSVFSCPSHGRGNTLVNHVYQVRNASNYSPDFSLFPYSSLGCWIDNAQRPALRNLEGDELLDNIPSLRINAISKCHQVSSRLNLTVFAISDGGQCWGALDDITNGFYTIYGRASFCPRDGKGHNLTNHVYQIKNARNATTTLLNSTSLSYSSLGCWNDSNNTDFKALRLNEGLFVSLDGDYRLRADPVHKCYQVAQSRGHNIFSLQDGGQCYSMFDSVQNGSYRQYGANSYCIRDGKGSTGINHVFQIKNATGVSPLPAESPYFSSGCWKDSNIANFTTLRLNEGINATLDGDYRFRTDAINKCYKVAQNLGHNVFALQNGGQCYSMLDIFPGGTYSHYGRSGYCPNDGKGALNINHVYKINSDPSERYDYLGCWDYYAPTYNSWRRTIPLEYRTYTRRIPDCMASAKLIGHRLFAMRDGDCYSMKEPTPDNTYGAESGKRNDRRSRVCSHYWSRQPIGCCPGDQGLRGSRHVDPTMSYMQVPDSPETPGPSTPFTSLGCWNDSSDTTRKALRLNEGFFATLDGNFQLRSDAINKCYRAAQSRGHNVFALQNGGECYSMADVLQNGSYSQYGASNFCPRDGRGSLNVNHVYQIKNIAVPDPRIRNASFASLGCWNDDDTVTEALFAATEGKHSMIDGDYRFRTNAIQKCFAVARSRGHNIFALQDGGRCFSTFDLLVNGTYSKRGASTYCPMDGKGGATVNHVYVDSFFECNPSVDYSPLQCWWQGAGFVKKEGLQGMEYKSLGCFTDSANIRALRSNEGKNISSLDGNPANRQDAVNKCFQIAYQLQHNIFALQNGECYSMSDVVPGGDYARYSNVTTCPAHGRGAPLLNHVYQIQGAPEYKPDYNILPYSSLGCWNDNAQRSALRSLEGDPVLDVIPSLRMNAIFKCHQVASRLGLTVFGISDGGKCWGALDDITSGSYATYGRANFCPRDGKGHSLVNHVYQNFGIATASSVLNYDQLPYTFLGCFNDSNNTLRKTLRLNEGLFPILDGDYWLRSDAINKCFRVAQSRGHNVFALQDNGQCYSMLDLVPNGNYMQYGANTYCLRDRRGTPGINHVFQIKNAPAFVPLATNAPYASLGCWNDSAVRKALRANEGLFPTLDGDYRFRADAINKCYSVALSRGHNVFALQDGGQCFSMMDAVPGGSYTQYGNNSYCPQDGKGALNINHVYQIKNLPSVIPLTSSSPFTSLGCWNDSADPTFKSLRLNEGLNPNLDGNYQFRSDAINKCYRAALSRGHSVFALQDGGQCYSMLDSTSNSSYAQYGRNSFCPADGRGALNINHVYQIKNVAPAVGVPTTSPFISRGCWLDSNNMNTKALLNNEGLHANLTGDFRFRSEAIEKCYRFALASDHNVFALQNGGQCFSTLNDATGGNFQRYGAATFCPRDGLGAMNINHIYEIKRNIEDNLIPLGCWLWVPSLFNNKSFLNNEGRFPAILDGIAANRVNPLTKCHNVSRILGHNVFGLLNGQCFSSFDTFPGKEYFSSGRIGSCPSNGKGSASVMQIYQIKHMLDSTLTGLTQSLGCWMDSDDSNRKALRLNEGLFNTTLDDNYRSRSDALYKCYQVALQRGHNVYALQDGGQCYSGVDIVPGGSYSQYGNVSACPRDGRGGFNLNHVYAIRNATGLSFNWANLPYSSLGCYKDLSNDTAFYFDSRETAIGGDYRIRRNAIEDCYRAALNKSDNVFLLRRGGECFSGQDIIPGGDYMMDGPSLFCPLDGRGSENINHIYRIRSIPSKIVTFADLPFNSPFEYSSLGCWRDAGNTLSRVFRSQESIHKVLDGVAIDRQDPIKKCSQVARSLGHNIFALQKGECLSIYQEFSSVEYKKFGQAVCPSNGRGGIGVNHVYRLNSVPDPPMNIAVSSIAKLPIKSLGCFKDNPDQSARLRLQEFFDSRLDGNPKTRSSAITKCFSVAVTRGHNVFALQDGGTCYSGIDFIPNGYYARLGASSDCPVDGLGNKNISHVYQITNTTVTPEQVTVSRKWSPFGCVNFNEQSPHVPILLDWLNKGTLIVQSQEGKFNLTDQPMIRTDAIQKCYDVSKRTGALFFGIAKGGECFTYGPTILYHSWGARPYNMLQLQSSIQRYVGMTSECPSDRRGSRIGINVFIPL